MNRMRSTSSTASVQDQLPTSLRSLHTVTRHLSMGDAKQRRARYRIRQDVVVLHNCSPATRSLALEAVRNCFFRYLAVTHIMSSVAHVCDKTTVVYWKGFCSPVQHGETTVGRSRIAADHQSYRAKSFTEPRHHSTSSTRPSPRSRSLHSLISVQCLIQLVPRCERQSTGSSTFVTRVTRVRCTVTR